jgi:hypothetical protein
MTLFEIDLHPIALLGIMFCAVPAAQFPEEFTNLQVLPKDISRKQLESTMPSFAFALNVWLCLLPCGKTKRQEVRDGLRLRRQGYEEAARVMLQMVAAINLDYISKLPPAQTPPVQVQCVTCHHGLTQSRQLTSVLAEAIDQKASTLPSRSTTNCAKSISLAAHIEHVHSPTRKSNW